MMRGCKTAMTKERMVECMKCVNGNETRSDKGSGKKENETSVTVDAASHSHSPGSIKRRVCDSEKEMIKSENEMRDRRGSGEREKGSGCGQIENRAERGIGKVAKREVEMPHDETIGG
jgi:hypothetical protein